MAGNAWASEAEGPKRSGFSVQGGPNRARSLGPSRVEVTTRRFSNLNRCFRASRGLDDDLVFRAVRTGQESSARAGSRLPPSVFRTSIHAFEPQVGWAMTT